MYLRIYASILAVLLIAITVNAGATKCTCPTTCPTGTTCGCINGRDGRDGRDGMTLQGPPGRDGKDGSDGRDCIDCARGPKGEKGTAGPAGKAGEKGKDGAPGAKGEKGEKGPKGDAGAPGTKGPKGDNGQKGDKGPKGDAGAPGAKGANGDKGVKGDKGAKGDAGLAGTKGPKGDKGEKGACDPEALFRMEKVIQNLQKQLDDVKKGFASSKEEVTKSHAAVEGLKAEIRNLQKSAVKLGPNKKINQSLLPGGYSEYSVADLQWQSIHMSVASACRAITATGGSGDKPNRVFSRVKGKSCEEVCATTSFKECDAELTLMGNMVIAKTGQDELGRYYNYGCDDKGSLPAVSFESQVSPDQIMKGGTYISYCCCR